MAGYVVITVLETWKLQNKARITVRIVEEIYAQFIVLCDDLGMMSFLLAGRTISTKL